MGFFTGNLWVDTGIVVSILIPLIIVGALMWPRYVRASLARAQRREAERDRVNALRAALLRGPPAPVRCPVGLLGTPNGVD